MTLDDVAAFHSFLESHPDEAHLAAFKKSQKFKDVVRHFKDEGATDEDIEKMTQPALFDPEMVNFTSHA